jgi:tetratricopeptide (TPR) repeat protein
VLMAASMVACDAGDSLAAKRYAEAELAQARALGDDEAACSALNNLAKAEYELDELEAAGRHFHELLGLAQAIRNDFQLSIATANLGMLKVARGEYADGQALLERSLALDTTSGGAMGRGATVCSLGWALLGLGDAPGAETRFLEALQLAEQVQWQRLTGECLQGLAVVCASTSRPLQAATLSGITAALQEEHGFKPEPEPSRLADQALQEVEQQIGRDSLTEAASRGRTLAVNVMLVRELLREPTYGTARADSNRA